MIPAFRITMLQKETTLNKLSHNSGLVKFSENFGSINFVLRIIHLVGTQNFPQN